MQPSFNVYGSVYPLNPDSDVWLYLDWSPKLSSLKLIFNIHTIDGRIVPEYITIGKNLNLDIVLATLYYKGSFLVF